jgi:hypothetical protein
MEPGKIPQIPTTQQEVVFNLSSVLTGVKLVKDAVAGIQYQPDEKWLQMQALSTQTLGLLQQISTLALQLSRERLERLVANDTQPIQ